MRTNQRLAQQSQRHEPQDDGTRLMTAGDAGS
jgi:hypothetical protein